MNRAKSYSSGFKWGKREHKLEGSTSKFLLWGFLATLATVAEWYFLGHFYVGVVAVILFVIAFLVHLLARVSHKVEKHYHEQARR